MTLLANPRRWGVPGFVLAALLGVSSPGAADWLVTREGGRVETKGIWTVKGKLVVFHTADGKLSSMRLADVDLDASRRATEEAVAAQAQAAAEPEKPPERRKSVRVITDKDVRKAETPAEESGSGEPSAGETEAAHSSARAAGSGILVETWSQERHPEEDHVLINGTLLNTSNATAADLKINVMIYDESGSLMATSQAALAAGALSPGQKSAFRAEFPGIFSFASIKFEAQSRPLNTRPQDQPIPPAPPEGSETGI